MAPIELIIYALLIGLGVGLLIGRTWAAPPAPPAAIERIYIVVAPTLSEGAAQPPGRWCSVLLREFSMGGSAMNSQQRRICRFWLEGGVLTDPPPEPQPRIAYVYGLDTQEQTVHRFRSIGLLVDWMNDGDGRERVNSNHAMVKKYRNANLWTDGGDDHG